MSNEIKFDYADDGKITSTSGSTEFSNLPLIFALMETKKIVYSPECRVEYATDLEGLRALNNAINQFLIQTSIIVSALGTFLVYVDKHEIGNDELNQLGWAITGLSDLFTEIAQEQIFAMDALKQAEEAKKEQP